MLGTDSVLAQIRDLAIGRHPQGTTPARMSMVDNTAAAVQAQFGRTPFEGPWLRVELREPPEVVNPLTGKAMPRPPTAILKQGERALAMLVGELLIVSRTAPRCVRMPLIREARERVFDYEQVDDGRLERLVAG
ncbi:MAG: hypothetical protein ACJ766_17475 [Thermoleophilaceae bacterium]|jgi:hypothetical protein